MAKPNRKPTTRLPNQNDVSALDYARGPVFVVPTTPPTPLAAWAGLVLLSAGTFIAFRPALSADFVTWDDPDYVRDNTMLRSTDGLRKLWNPSNPDLQQYYPLVFTSFWIEYHFAGGNAHVYHATNLALHLVNIALVFWLLRRLGLSPWAALGASAVFALHPMQVASVVWIAERKNVLSGLFYLLTLLLYLAARRHAATPDMRTRGRPSLATYVCYLLCLLMFVAGLLSKTQIVTLPLVLLLADWMLSASGRLRQIGWPRRAALVAPMLAIGLVAALVTSRVEQSKNPTLERPTPAKKPLIVANSAAFYVGKFLLPVNLAPVYPLWDLSAPSIKWGLALLAWPLLLAAVLIWRHRIGAPMLWALAQFFLSLLPALGFVSFNYQQYSFVADHYLYFACIGGGMALALLAERLAGSSRIRSAVVAIAGVAAITLCGSLTHAEVRHWQTIDAFWLHALDRWPECFPANLNLANHYVRTGRSKLSVPLYGRASRVNPGHLRCFQAYVSFLRVYEGDAPANEAIHNKIALGEELIKRFRFAEARKVLAVAATVAPKNSPFEAEVQAALRLLPPTHP